MNFISAIRSDDKSNLLHINTVVAGKSNLHKFQTAVQFVINEEEIKDLEVFENARG
jgi:hypothetical protein